MTTLPPRLASGVKAGGAGLAGRRRESRCPPSSLYELKSMIARRKVVFPGELERVMRAILDQPEFIAFGTAASIAGRCGVSRTTVVRLASHLGFGKFRDFKNLFREHFKEAANAGR